MARWTFFLLLALVGLACSSGEGKDPRPQVVAGDYGVYFDEVKLELSLERKGAEGAEDVVLLRFPSDGLQLGVVDQVRDEVKRRIDDFAPGGGFVFAAVHNVQAFVPPENIEAAFDTALNYGASPSAT